MKPMFRSGGRFLLIAAVLSALTYLSSAFTGKIEQALGGSRWAATANVTTGYTQASMAVGPSLNVALLKCGARNGVGWEHNHLVGYFSLVVLSNTWDPNAYSQGWCIVEDQAGSGSAMAEVY